MSAPVSTPTVPAPASPAATVSTIQIGMGWFPEQAGGLNRYFYDLVRHLPGAGAAVRGFVTGTPDVARDSAGAVRAFAARDAAIPRRWMAARSAVRDALRADRDALPVAHFALYALPAIGVLERRPFVIHFHGPWASEATSQGVTSVSSAAMRFVERTVYRRGTRFIVLSRAFAELLASRYGVPASAIEVVPGGVDVERFAPTESRQDARRALGWAEDRRIIVAVRRLKRRMGLENLIDAMVEVRKAEPAALLLIAGRGNLSVELEQRIAERGLREHVRLLGYVPDEQLPRIYRAAEMSVVPTVALEGFGLIAAESLAAGTPVLVTPVGGLPEVVERLDPNLIFGGTTPADLTAGLAGALNGRLSLPTSDACRAFAVAQYDWNTIARRLARCYADVVAGR